MCEVFTPSFNQSFFGAHEGLENTGYTPKTTYYTCNSARCFTWCVLICNNQNTSGLSFTYLRCLGACICLQMGTPAERDKVAVIGSGIAGLVSGYLLSKTYEVRVGF